MHDADIFPPIEKALRPPEPVYEPGPPTARLTPGPRDLLVPMRWRRAARARTTLVGWTPQRPDGDPEKITERPIGPLRQNSFIARDGVRPDEPTG